MTIVRTDNIVNLYPNAIVDISQDSPAVVTVPVIERVVSNTGTIGTVTGSGTSGSPWLATITNMTTTAGLKTGDVIIATPDVGDFGAGGEVSVKSIVGTQSIQIKKIGGTTPTAGTIEYISLPAVSTLPSGFANSDVIQITGVENATITFTQSLSTKTFAIGERVTQATSGAKATVTAVVYNGASSTLSINTVSGTFDTTHTVTGSISGATCTPTAVVGMTELKTAGLNGTNTFYVDVLTDTTFALYKDSGLTVEVDSSAFTAAIANTGQYTTIDEVVITIPN